VAACSIRVVWERELLSSSHGKQKQRNKYSMYLITKDDEKCDVPLNYFQNVREDIREWIWMIWKQRVSYCLLVFTIWYKKLSVAVTSAPVPVLVLRLVRQMVSFLAHTCRMLAVVPLLRPVSFARIFLVLQHEYVSAVQPSLPRQLLPVDSALAGLLEAVLSLIRTDLICGNHDCPLYEGFSFSSCSRDI